MIGALGAIAVALAYRGAPHRLAAHARNDHPRDSRLLQMATSSGLSASGVVGLRFALQSGRGRTSVPARSVLVGATLAVILVTTTLTFSSGLHTLVSRPALYGWNWNYTLTSVNDVPPAALAALHRDPDVAASTGYLPLSIQINGQTVPVLLGGTHATVAPPVLSGHAVDGNNQVVLGPTTLSLLHKHIGDTVIGSFGTPNTAPLYLPPFKLVITGTTTLPAIGGASNFADHPSMGTGAVLSKDVSPAISGATQSTDPNQNGPGLVFVRLRNGVSAAAGRADMQRIATLANKAFASDLQTAGDNVAVLGVQHPAEIVNYQSTGATPVVLAARSCPWRHRRTGAHPGRIGTAAATGSRHVEDPRVHRPATRRHHRLAGLGHRRHRRRHRCARRHRGRAATLDPVRPQHQRCPRSPRCPPL